MIFPLPLSAICLKVIGLCTIFFLMTSDPIALVCPLDWGLGHATRCIPVIYSLRDQGIKVIVAADGRPWDFFHNEYPGLDLLRFPGTEVRYPSGSNMVLAMAANIPRLLNGFRLEHAFLKKLVKETGARLVVSDNRYGCWHTGVKSVFMTHQLNIQVPEGLHWSAHPLRKITSAFIGKYDECWIPDVEDEGGLSGRLSHFSGLPGHCHFIGPLTRFSSRGPEADELPCPIADIVVMISGPEPQRSILESLVIKQLKETSHTAIIAGGRTESTDREIIDGRIYVFPHLESALMKYYLGHARFVICRSGYSTLMDLAALGKTAILIPTPGQTEQEYLARRLSKKKIHYSVSQKNFNLGAALEDSAGFTGVLLQNDLTALRQRVKRMYDQAAIRRAR